MRVLQSMGIALLWLAAAGRPARAESANDYAYQRKLSTSGREAVVQYRLPSSVYVHARSAGLEDLRVFDSRGIVLPFVLRLPSEEAQASRHSVPVRVFPVFGEPDGPGIETGVEIHRTPDGALVSLGSRVNQRHGSALSALVLDMAPSGPGDASGPAAFDMLRFVLPPDMPRYDAEISVEVSVDLKHWQEIAQSRLSWMVSGDGAALAADRIEFEPHEFRYARIRWLEGKPVQFARVTAETVRYSGQPAPLETMVLPAAAGKNPGELMYPSSVAIPVQRIGLQFAERNVSLPVELGRYVELPALRGRGNTIWQFSPSLRATFYRIEQGGRERRSGDLPVEPTHQQHWVLRPLATSDSRPALKVSWAPATLVFLTNGHGPYTLAYGRDRATSAQRDIEQVAPGLSAGEISKAEHASATPEEATRRTVMPGPSNAELAATSSRTRTSALWAALLVGLCALGAMAWQLYRQMKTSSQ